MSELYDKTYNPDVLSCLANLSNDEVFTPPEVANQMLDMLPKEIWSDPNATFLDPACKSGVFLREIAKRLIKGLEDEFPDLDERLEHIFKKQLHGVAITELTSLLSRRSVYCSKYPNSKYSVVEFDNAEGSIRFRRCEHSWVNDKCKYCGASKEEYDRGDELETYAYEFIHLENAKEMLPMKFDVIIGNPPYQLSDGGHGKSATPIYHKFIEQAKKLRPRYLSMIVPSRWFAGGRGLDQFRAEMLGDKRLRRLVDYERFRDAFPGVDVAGGVCYFLWDRDNEGPCTVINASADDAPVTHRYLDEYPTFIRDNRSIEIVKKVRKQHQGRYLDEVVSPSKPFGLRTFYKPKEEGVPCYFIQRIGKKFADPADISDPYNLLNKWKLLVPRSPIAGQTDFSKPVKFYNENNTRIAAPGECCTESFIVAFASTSEEEVKSFKSYLFTKVARFLLLQAVVSQDITKKKFFFVPDLGAYSGEYTDEELCSLWKITPDEWGYIDSRIAAVDSDE